MAQPAITQNVEKNNIYLEAVKDGLPLIIGLLPFGITYGIVASQAGLTAAETLLMSLIVFAGAAQFIGITMIAAGASPMLIVFTTLLINLRHLLMGVSLIPYLKPYGLKWQSILAFGTVDESYAITMKRFMEKGPSPVYQLMLNSTFYLCWASFSLIGVSIGHLIANPLDWGLDFAMPATFIAIVAPQLKDRIILVVAVVAGIAAVLGMLYLPGKWYIIVAAIVGVIVGGGMELWFAGKSSS
ncbi:MAG: AzlC family ABC transporter permease [Bacillota bacterium]|nr:AzlC family ABC transporter permease [Bacillota bacterium]